jgi:hypothetical protein
MPPKPPRSTVFISHSSRDRTLADGLYQALTRWGDLECWMDNFDLSPEAGSFPEQIVAALQSSGALVLVDRFAARQSDYVRRELQTAGDLQIPVVRCRLDAALPPSRVRLSHSWLRLRVLMQLRRRSLGAAGLLAVLLIALAVVLFIFGTQVVPALARADLRNLPAAFRPTATTTPTPDPSLPEVAAPFHFRPSSLIYDAAFTDVAFDGRLDEGKLYSNSQPRVDLLTITQHNGLLAIDFPSTCPDWSVWWECRLWLTSPSFAQKGMEYFGVRARLNLGNFMRGIAVALANNLPDENLVGYGWYFTDRVMAFQHSPPELPEPDFNTLVTLDNHWHAYEILRDPQTFTWYYYIDGQLVGSHTPDNGAAWNIANLRVTIISLTTKLNDPNGTQTIETNFEIERILVGSF